MLGRLIGRRGDVTAERLEASVTWSNDEYFGIAVADRDLGQLCQHGLTNLAQIACGQKRV